MTHRLARSRRFAYLALAAGAFTGAPAVATAPAFGLGVAQHVRADTTTAEVTAQQIATALVNDARFVQDGYPAMTADEAAQLTQTAIDSTTPIYVALVSDATSRAAGGLTALLKSVESQTGLPGTYVVADTQGFRASSTMFEVAPLAQQAASSGGDAFTVLSTFIKLVTQRAESSNSTPDAAPGRQSDSGIPWALVAILGAGAIGGGTWYVRSKARAAAAARADLEKVRGTLNEDITVIGEQIAALDVNDPRLGEAGREQLGAGITAYNSARAACDAMTSAAQAGTVTAALDDARYAVGAAQAAADGLPIPARRPPCLFDPRHGTSSRDVMWIPPAAYGQYPTPRDVPACEQCARTVDLGGIPASRMVPSANGEVPYWAGGPAYAPYAAGYYNSYGAANMLGAVLVGTMFASMYSPMMWGAAGAGGMGGVGDVGGGSFGDSFGGAGDIGGGDFGGFGGGDFGGF